MGKRSAKRLTKRAVASAVLVLDSEINACLAGQERLDCQHATRETTEERRNLRALESDLRGVIAALELLARQHSEKRAASRERLRAERKANRQLVLPAVPFHGIQIVEVKHHG